MSVPRSSSSTRQAWLVSVGLVLVALGVASGSRAQDSASTEADALFAAGKAKLAAKDYARACPLLAESFRVEPATGTLLAQAICYERAGKLASATVAYREVVARSRKESRPDRMQAAAAKVAELAPQLSHLHLQAQAVAATPGLLVRIDGERLDLATLDEALAVDAGSHTLEVSAPARQSWSATVTIADPNDDKTLVVTPLAAVALVAPEPPAQQAEAAPPPTLPPAAAIAAGDPASAAPRRSPALRAGVERPAADAGGLSSLQVSGLFVLGAGVVGLAGATVFTLRALHDNDASKAGCDGDLCTAAGRAQRLDARQAGEIATVSFILGSTATAAGVLMTLLGARARPSGAAANAPVAGGVALAPWLGARSLGAFAQGVF
jgi:hypothetical protein